MGLSLVIGPAHAGKVAALLDRYLAAADRDPWLVVPNRGDVDRVERDLLTRTPALLAGTIGTFDDLFTSVAGGDATVSLGEPARAVLVRRAVAAAPLTALRASAGTRGFSDALAATLAELDAGLVDTDSIPDELGSLVASYRRELEAVGLPDRPAVRRRAVEALRSELASWNGAPVFAYGFEDLTAAEWALVEALAARAEVTVSLPYEPGRTVFGSLRRTAEDLAGLADDVTEYPASSAAHLPPALAHVERALFGEGDLEAPPIDGAVRFFEGAGTRGTAELVVESCLDLIRAGVPAEELGIVVESGERWRAPLSAAFRAFGVPLAFELPVRLGQTPLGAALLSLLRYAWGDGARESLFAYLRSPYSGLARPSVDFVEGRLRGRAVHTRERVEEEFDRLRGEGLVVLSCLQDPSEPVAGARQLLRSMVAAAHGRGEPRAEAHAAVDLRVAQSLEDLLAGLATVDAAGVERVSRDEVLGALDRHAVVPLLPDRRGQVAVVDLLRARTRRFDTAFVLGLEEGALPRRGSPSPFLDEETRSRLGSRLELPEQLGRERYLFYTACTRPRRQLVLVREAATDEGTPVEASPFWHEVVSLFPAEEVASWTRRRPLSALTWPLETAPTERERLRAVARLAATDEAFARALARANGWQRRFERAVGAFDRRTRLTNPAVLDWLAQKTSFAVTELERFADCSSAWLFERVVSPKKIDAEPDAMLRGQVAHTALHRFYQAVPREIGVDVLRPEHVEQAVGLMRRCLDEALTTGVRLDLTDLQRAELRQSLLQDLEGFARDEAQSPLELVPRRLEVSFGSDRSPPELQRGLALGDGLTVSGKIDRVDIDPYSASGIVQDYKSGKSAHSARDIERELRLQIPLYLLVLRDLVGVEPLGGVYRALSGRRVARGMLRQSAAEVVPGFMKYDYLDDEAFWAQVDGARERAATLAKRIRAGDVRHDPKGDGCPSWCDLWPMCRVERA